MDRLISEQAVIKILILLFIGSENFKVAINSIKAIPSAEPKWIPVSERLPKEIKTKGHGLCNVLVTHKYAGITRTHQAVFDQGKFLKLDTYREDDTVIAWQPLPEPYKAESEDKDEQN